MHVSYSEYSAQYCLRTDAMLALTLALLFVLCSGMMRLPVRMHSMSNPASKPAI